MTCIGVHVEVTLSVHVKAAIYHYLTIKFRLDFRSRFLKYLQRQDRTNPIIALVCLLWSCRMKDPISNSPDHIDVGESIVTVVESIVTVVSRRYMYAMHELIFMGPF